jgi:hypothetical protein
MKFKFDDIELPCNRANEAELTLEEKDSVVIKMGNEEISIKYKDGRWSIFSTGNVITDTKQSIETGYSV